MYGMVCSDEHWAYYGPNDAEVRCKVDGCDKNVTKHNKYWYRNLSDMLKDFCKGRDSVEHIMSGGFENQRCFAEWCRWFLLWHLRWSIISPQLWHSNETVWSELRNFYLLQVRHRWFHGIGRPWKWSERMTTHFYHIKLPFGNPIYGFRDVSNKLNSWNT